MLHFNYQLLVNELTNRGIRCSFIGKSECIKAQYGSHIEYFIEDGHTHLPYAYHIIFNDKYLVKELMKKENISVARSELFSIHEQHRALIFAQKLGFPVVLKGLTFSHGCYVFPHIINTDELKNIWEICVFGGNEYAESVPEQLLLEQHIFGEDYRFLVFNNHKTIVAKRKPPHVTGDGVHTIQELVDAESQRRLNPRSNCSGEIYLSDQDGLRCLSHQGKTIDSILEDNMSILLRYNSNVTTGGTCELIQSGIHPSYFDLTKKIFNLFPKINYLAIDLLITDPTQIADPERYVVSEFCTYPGFSLFLMPTYGKGYNILKPIVDSIFPETAHLKRAEGHC